MKVGQRFTTKPLKGIVRSVHPDGTAQVLFDEAVETNHLRFAFINANFIPDPEPIKAGDKLKGQGGSILRYEVLSRFDFGGKTYLTVIALGDLRAEPTTWPLSSFDKYVVD